MQRQNGVATDIARDCLFRRGLRFLQFLAVGEHGLHDPVDQVVGQILVRDREIVEADRLISPGPAKNKNRPGP